MGCKPKKPKCGNNKIKMSDIDSINSDSDIGSKKIVDWWYHYVSSSLIKDKSKYVNNDFILASHKFTPDFANYNYHPEICHYQIGQTANIGSIVVMVTTVGNKNKKKYITGYYKIKKIGKWVPIKREDWKKPKRTRDIVYMDKNDSLLLLDDPIEINRQLAKRLFTEKDKNYWEDDDMTFAQKIGYTTRNCHLTPNQKDIIITELKKRFDQGSKNYLGREYQLFKSGRNRRE